MSGKNLLLHIICIGSCLKILKYFVYLDKYGSFSWIVILMFAVKLLNNREKTHKKRNIIALVRRNRRFSYAKPPL